MPGFKLHFILVLGINEIIVTKKWTKINKRERVSLRKELAVSNGVWPESIHCNGPSRPTHPIKDSLIHKEGPSHKGVPNGLYRAWVSPFNLFSFKPSFFVDGARVKLVYCTWPLMNGDPFWPLLQCYCIVLYILVHLF